MWDPDRKTENVWLSIADLPQCLHAVATDSKEYVSDLAAKKMRLIPKGSLLVSFKLTLGRLAYAGRDLFSNEAIASLLDIDERQISKEFLYWALTAFDWHKAAEGDQKIKGKTLNKAKLKTIPIPLPAPEEQQRIVTVLDEAFEGLARARAHAEANAQNARELIEAGLGTAFSPEVAEQNGWEICELGAIADLSYGYTTKAQAEATGPRFLRITDIQYGAVDWSSVPFCKTPPDDYERYRVKRGDIVFARTGATTGKSYLLTEDLEAVAASYLIRLRLTSSKLKPEYLAFFFQSDIYWENIRAGISGSTQGGFNASKLKELRISVPPLDVQDAVISRLSEIQRRAESLANAYGDKLQYLDDLRQSLLQKAFAGELR